MTKWLLRFALLPFFLTREIWRRLGGTGQHPSPLWQDDYRGGPVAVVALFQSGQIRPDVLSLFLALRRQGVYVIAVNTGHLLAAGARLPVNCYIERRNYGRDFGSYRVGVRLARQLGGGVSRLVLLNDSVFYVSSGLDRFIARLLTSSADVCSATENTEVRLHQTSFCLSFSDRCIHHPRFETFWSRYIPSDLRPATILLGEVALSRKLLAAGLSRETLASRDSVKRLLEDQPDLISFETGHGLRSATPDWCVNGNLTHRAPSALLELGVPLIKLDLSDQFDIESDSFTHIRHRLPVDDAAALSEIMLAKARLLGKKAFWIDWARSADCPKAIQVRQTNHLDGRNKLLRKISLMPRFTLISAVLTSSQSDVDSWSLSCPRFLVCSAASSSPSRLSSQPTLLVRVLA